MSSVPLLISVIGLLIVVNGLFAAMEIALVSVSRARLKRLENENKRGASTAIFLQSNIDDFFAAVQIGVTFVGTLSSVLGGAFAVDFLAPVVAAVGVEPASPFGQSLAIFLVAATISYVSLVAGELVPKSLARRFPGRISLALAGPFRFFSRIMRPVVRLLTVSTWAALRVIGVSRSHQAVAVTAEELRMMASELVESREMTSDVYDMLVRVTRLSHIRVEDIMVPRHRIIAVEVDSRRDPQLRRKIVNTYRAHPFTYFPVVETTGENVIGVVNIKDVLLHDPKSPSTRLLRPAVFTARGQTVDRVLATMQKKDVHFSVVVDEHGVIDGIVTLEDILEELVGEIDSAIGPELARGRFVKPEGALVVDGQITLHELKGRHGIALPSSKFYSTLAGFIMDYLGKIPSPGEYVDFAAWRFQVLAMARNRIKDVKIIRLGPEQEE
ncbi:MAG: hemolysin family protein [Desulfomonile sp.]|nr:hemolysin family protein [Desulfomonile sp.]